MIYEILNDFSKSLGCDVLKNEMLGKYTTFKIGGPADLFIKVYNIKALQKLIKYLNEKEVPTFVIGNGSNLLISDEGFRGVVIHPDGDFKKIYNKSDNIIECGSGASLAKSCVFALQNGLSGLEFAWGIPGSCGGAIFMNAGAYNLDMSSVITYSTHINSDGSIETIGNNDMLFAYRKSVYSDNKKIVTSMGIKLTPDDPLQIRKRMYQFMSRRKSKQPLEYPNAGSIFKRPGKGFYAGALIEGCGLKGKQIGGAMVSQKHAGFIVNTGSASCKDVVNLINLIKSSVYKNYGITLECEIKILGKV